MSWWNHIEFVNHVDFGTNKYFECQNDYWRKKIQTFNNQRSPRTFSVRFSFGLAAIHCVLMAKLFNTTCKSWWNRTRGIDPFICLYWLKRSMKNYCSATEFMNGEIRSRLNFNNKTFLLNENIIQTFYRSRMCRRCRNNGGSCFLWSWLISIIRRWWRSSMHLENTKLKFFWNIFVLNSNTNRFSLGFDHACVIREIIRFLFSTCLSLLHGQPIFIAHTFKNWN